MIALVPLFALLAAPAADAPSIWLASVTASGLDDGDAQALVTRMRTELGAVNALVVDGDAVDETCSTDAACLAKRTAAVGAGAGLSARFVRGGPVVQVSIIVVDVQGNEWFRNERIVPASELSSSPLLPKALLTRLARDAATPVDPEETGGVDPPPSQSEASTAEAGDAPIPVLGVVGLGVAALGLVTGVVGAGMAVAGNDVLNDPTASTADKEAAYVFGPTGIVLGGVGGVVAVGGAVVAGIGLATME